MNQIAQSNRVSVRYVKEEEWGVTPNIPFQEIRVTGEKMTAKKSTEESAVIRADRQVEAIVYTGLDSTGEIKTELTTQDKEFIAAALQSKWQERSVKGLEFTDAVTLTKLDQKITFANAVDYAKYEGARWIRLTGSIVENNGAKRIVAKDAVAKTLTLAAGSLKGDEDRTLNPNLTLYVNFVRNGVDAPSFTREVAFLDSGKFKVATGERVAKMDMSVDSRKIITCDFAFAGKDVAVYAESVASSVTPAAVETPASASVNVGSITDGINPLATAVSSLKLSLNNNERIRPQIGSPNTADVGFGKNNITGTLTNYFADILLAAKFLSHSTVDLASNIAMPVGKVLGIHVPSAHLDQDDFDAAGANQDIMENITFKAQVDPVLGYTIQFDCV